MSSGELAALLSTSLHCSAIQHHQQHIPLQVSIAQGHVPVQVDQLSDQLSSAGDGAPVVCKTHVQHNKQSCPKLQLLDHSGSLASGLA